MPNSFYTHKVVNISQLSKFTRNALNTHHITDDSILRSNIPSSVCITPTPFIFLYTLIRFIEVYISQTKHFSILICTSHNRQYQLLIIFDKAAKDGQHNFSRWNFFLLNQQKIYVHFSFCYHGSAPWLWLDMEFVTDARTLSVLNDLYFG